jgi:hypothetical protein
MSSCTTLHKSRVPGRPLAPNICESSARNLSQVTVVAPTVLRWFTNISKMFAPLYILSPTWDFNSRLQSRSQDHCYLLVAKYFQGDHIMQQPHKRTSVKCSLSYITIHRHVSVTSASIIRVPHAIRKVYRQLHKMCN